ncbi:phosphate ABC transporter substrate-binding protein PstS [Caballeronia ptereochthonis]|uniref:Phosphate-binding protein PstS n=1 Tax=Caballeronia ptereochthonis TaxID=1777144 RepID=A0A158A0W2_9BURK|nr:phosphate ABC transporter substrate-binding protein PstS [Caballeronia ptereochthonis]SAK51373.1 ABC phosphate transporter, periplasmic ligand binding protein [Caballeronia ptereochthonis]
MNRKLTGSKRLLLAVAFCAAACHAVNASCAEISGAGSTFVYPLLKWAATYRAKTGQRVDYEPTGSGNGIRQIKAASVTFGASDMPLAPEELHAAGLAPFPVVIGGVVPVVNLAGVGPGQIRLTGQLLADIYLGKIVSWNDPAIVSLNPSIRLPGLKIVVVHRNESSGTTFNWVNFLSQSSASWKDSVGAATTVKWPIGVGAAGNDGVATYIRNVEGSIGYVELTYALQRNLSYTAVQNRSGTFVQPSRESFSAADWSERPDFYQIVTDAPGDNAWPIAGVVFVLVSREAKDPAASKAALAFFRWALNEGQADADAEHYISLPPVLVKQIEAYWSENIK